MKAVHMVAFVLLVVGGLNWLFVAGWDYNLVESILPGWANGVYWLVGLSAIYEVLTHGKRCRTCKP